MTCGFCRLEFSEDSGVKGCGGCSGGCHSIHCPRCNYKNPLESQALKRFINYFGSTKTT